ncbi:MAG: low molecular weight phosphotyrosine protein phosphatase [Streptosporangiales bacterium]|nr:low molecular weight phosphotyrosine protein phosphatase [Streptosporangiales bacterium]
MAEQVLRAELAEAGLAGAVEVDSSGTGGWHEDEPMDPRAAAALAEREYPTAHMARRFVPAWFADRDLVLAMDAHNLATLRRGLPGDAAERLRMFASFAPGAPDDAEVPDPYYGDAGFDEVLDLIERSAKGLVRALGDLLGT